jgi:hypothetical protein
MSKEVDFDFNWTDITILESDGNYAEVIEIMNDQDMDAAGWMIRSGLTIDSDFGLAQFVLHFYENGKIFIKEYSPSVGDVYYNPDLQALSYWAQQKGWQVPEPDTTIVKRNVDFWKHYWQTLIVDSAYLDEVFGIRPNMQPDYHTTTAAEEEGDDEE